MSIEENLKNLNLTIPECARSCWKLFSIRKIK